MPQSPLKVAVSTISPFVMFEKSKFTGFEVELWENIAKEMGKDSDYTSYNFQELIPLVRAQKADVAFSSITISEAREEIVDFSQPTFDSGLQILLDKDRGKIHWLNTVKTFLKVGYKQLIKPILVLLVIAFVLGNLIWLAERSANTFNANYWLGLPEAIWLAFSAVIGSADQVLHFELQTWWGMLVLQIAQFVNLLILGLIVGEIAAFVTTRKIRMHIEGPQDLAGKTVATVRKTTCVKTLKELGATVVEVVRIEAAIEKLKKGEVEAVVYDAPVLNYYVMNGGSSWAQVVGPLFARQNYGFAVPDNSKLLEKINQAILTLKENGVYAALHKKWFGEMEE